MSDLTPSFVRTAVPLLVGSLAAQYGFDPNDPLLAALLPAVIGWAYYVLVRLLELKAPTLGYLLGIAKAPAYSDKPPPQPAPELVEDLSNLDRMDGLGAPVQTDNRPKDEDPADLDERLATGGQEFTGEMR